MVEFGAGLDFSAIVNGLPAAFMMRMAFQISTRPGVLSLALRNARAIVWCLAAVAALIPASVALAQANPLGTSVDAAVSAAQSVKLATLPDSAGLALRMKVRGVETGAPVYLRIFKEEAELEVWMRSGRQFVRVITYPICKYDGQLGPKLLEGDRQSPEGFYTVSPAQLRFQGRWHRGLDLFFPNAFDRANNRTGSYLLIHGGCTSVGCYAIENGPIEELFDLAVAALESGQRRIPVHIFPFRMTERNLERHVNSPWIGFWRRLATAYALFEASRVPPLVSVCDSSYVIQPGDVERPDREVLEGACLRSGAEPGADAGAIFSVVRAWPERAPRITVAQARELDALRLQRGGSMAGVTGGGGHVAKAPDGTVKRINVACNQKLASCKRWIALKKSAISRGLSDGGSRRKKRRQ